MSNSEVTLNDAAIEPVKPAPLNTLAIVSFVLAFFATIPSLVLGIIALRQIRTSGEGGRGLAIAGVVCSAIFTALIFIFVLLYIGLLVAMIAAAASAGDCSPFSANYDPRYCN